MPGLYYRALIGPGTWPKAKHREPIFRFFGYVVGLETEFGFFLLSELEEICTPSGAQVERDLTFTKGRLTDVVAPDE